MKPHDLSPRRSLTMGVCCTLSAALGLFISSGLAQDATAAQASSKIDPTPYTVQERALNHRVMSRVIQTTDADGKSITKTNSYTELATGLHYLQDGKLVESKAEITLLPQGGAAATQGQHKAYFPANLNGGVIDLVMPDGRELKSQIRGLGYYDKASGKNVILAEVRDTEGTLYPPNVLVYENAFNGVRADVRYSYTRYGFEQDIIFREPIVAPDKFGLNPETTRIETLTEFIESPTPKKSVSTTSTRATDPDQNLDFASMKMVRGRAFSIGAPSRTNQSISVSKSWEQIEGRNFLIEQVDYLKVAPQLQALPKPVKGASLNPKSRNSKIGRLASLRQLPAATKVASKTLKPVRMAKAETKQRPGLVMDYIAVNPSVTDYTFQSGNTYLVDVVYLDGATTFEAGAVIKHSYTGYSSPSLFISGGLRCESSSCNPAVYTHVDDNSVGESIGSGYPSRTYGPLIYLMDYSRILPWQVKNLVVKHGEFGIMVGDNSGVHFQNCQFFDDLTAVRIDDGNTGAIDLDNDLFSDCDMGLFMTQSQTVSGHNVTAGGYWLFCSGSSQLNLTDTLLNGPGSNIDSGTESVSSGSGFTDLTMLLPTANPQTIQICRINTSLLITLTGSDPCNDDLTFIKVSNPSQGSLGAISQINRFTASVVYTPNTLPFCGEDSFTFKVRNGARVSTPDTVTISAGDPNPVANCADVMTGKNTPVTITLSGSDNCNDSLTFAATSGPNPPASLGIITQTDPTHATVVYTPNSTTFEGTDGFNYTASNCRGASSPAHVSIRVVPGPEVQIDCRPKSIQLSWTLPQDLRDLAISDYFEDFSIYRCSGVGCTPSSIPFAIITDQNILRHPEQWRFVDSAVVDGVTYCYQVTFHHRSASFCPPTVIYESPKSEQICSTTCCPSGGTHLWVDTGPTAQQMAEWIMAGSGISVVANSAHFEGKPGASGAFGNGLAAGLAYDRGVILSSGQISRAPGPNNSSGAGGTEPDNDRPGDPDLNALGFTTWDAAVLTFDITSTQQRTLSFDYVFASEEYSEYVGDFNDLVAIFIQQGNGSKENVALVPSTTQTVGVSTINNGNDGSITPPTPPINLQLYQHNVPEVIHVQFDGLTSGGANHYLTTLPKAILANTTYTIKIAIADVSRPNEVDHILDSAVFLKATVPCP